MAVFQHFLITRFNLVYSNSVFTRDRFGKNTQTDEWLAKRFQLFEDYCLPSIKAQKGVEGFRWLVLFSEDSTPLEYKQKVSKYSLENEFFIPVYIPDGANNKDWVLKAILEHLDKETSFLVTSRIDNDDSIHENMLKIVQENFHEQEDEILNFNKGIQYDARRKILCEYIYKDNPFLSRIEKIKYGKFETVFFLNHIESNKLHLTRYIDNTDPLWFQLIHDTNISNSIRLHRPIFDVAKIGKFNIGRKIRISVLRTLLAVVLDNEIVYKLKRRFKK